MGQKYNAKPCYINSLTGLICDVKGNDTVCCASQLEAKAYQYLLFNDVSFIYQAKVCLVKGNDKVKPINWIIDFYLPEYDCFIETKGYKTRDFIIKLNLFRLIYPNQNILIVSSIKEIKLSMDTLTKTTKVRNNLSFFSGMDTQLQVNLFN